MAKFFFAHSSPHIFSPPFLVPYIPLTGIIFFLLPFFQCKSSCFFHNCRRPHPQFSNSSWWKYLRMREGEQGRKDLSPYFPGIQAGFWSRRQKKTPKTHVSIFFSIIYLLQCIQLFLIIRHSVSELWLFLNMAVLNIFVHSFVRRLSSGWCIRWSLREEKEGKLKMGDWGLFRQVWAALKGGSIKSWWIAGSCQLYQVQRSKRGSSNGTQRQKQSWSCEGSGAAEMASQHELWPALQKFSHSWHVASDRELYTSTFLSSYSLTTAAFQWPNPNRSQNAREPMMKKRRADNRSRESDGEYPWEKDL